MIHEEHFLLSIIELRKIRTSILQIVRLTFEKIQVTVEMNSDKLPVNPFVKVNACDILHKIVL